MKTIAQNVQPMEPIPILTILITTYNREPILNALLSKLFEYETHGLSFKVIVSDDCSTDRTKDTCMNWSVRFNNFKYLKLEKNSGMDANFMNAYEACDTPYCWLLGDARCVDFNGLKTILAKLVENKHDALILNCHYNMKMPDKTYSDINTLLSEQGWHITNNSSCVIPRNFINRTLYHRYFGTTFLHMGIFVENLCMKETFTVAYLKDVRVRSVKVPSYTKNGWFCHPFLNFGRLWFTFVMSLPNQVDVSTKLKVLKDHNKYTHIFSPLRGIPQGKALYGKTFVESYRENRMYMPFVSNTPRILYDVIMLIPSWTINATINIYLKLKRAIYRNGLPNKWQQ